MLGNTELTALHHVAAAKNGGSLLTTPVLMILIGVVFYFFLIRPQQRRQKEMAKTQRSIVPGKRVMTTAGLFATVVAVEEDGVVLEIAPGVEARFVKQAIGQVIEEDADEDSAEADEADGTEHAPEAAGAEEPEAAAPHDEVEATPHDEVEAKTEPTTRADDKTADTPSVADDEEKSGKKHSA